MWLMTFQSLIGRLQTGEGGLVFGGLTGFQSLIGRLQTHADEPDTLSPGSVSIPHR